jgi:hypothetical protein
MLGVIYVECCFLLSVTDMPFMLNVIMLSAVMQNVAVPFLLLKLKLSEIFAFCFIQFFFFFSKISVQEPNTSWRHDIEPNCTQHNNTNPKLNKVSNLIGPI